ncbi:MAG: GNAT family N-acetyltransferase [Candidatus Eiseniibacteriota bacterium]
MLLTGRCVLSGPCDERGFVARSTERPLVSVFGDPGVEAVREAIEGLEGPLDLLAFDAMGPHLAAGLDDFTLERAIIHEPSDPEWYRAAAGSGRPGNAGDARDAGVTLRPVHRAEIVARDDLEPDVKADLIEACSYSPVVAACVGDRAISFCYASARTERWWDVSVDTLPEARGKGLAGIAARHLAAVMREQGRTATWGAVESNAASLAAASRLGFVPTSELWLLMREGRWPSYRREPA